jgi:hypothetical protein
MAKLRLGFLGAALIGCYLLCSVALAGAFTANVAPLAEDGVLRVLYVGGIKGNVKPCG